MERRLAVEPEVIAVAVVQREGRYLIGRRPAEVPQGGLWEFPGGKVLPEESAAEAAVRECREETGLVVQATGCLGVVRHEYGGEPGRAGERGAYAVQIAFVACQLVSEAGEPQPPFRWVRASQLVDYPFPAANAEIIRQLAEGPPPAARSAEKGSAEKGQA